jgi:hypothetical protein
MNKYEITECWNKWFYETEKIGYDNFCSLLTVLVTLEYFGIPDYILKDNIQTINSMMCRPEKKGTGLVFIKLILIWFDLQIKIHVKLKDNYENTFNTFHLFLTDKHIDVYCNDLIKLQVCYEIIKTSEYENIEKYFNKSEFRKFKKARISSKILKNLNYLQHE